MGKKSSGSSQKRSFVLALLAAAIPASAQHKIEESTPSVRERSFSAPTTSKLALLEQLLMRFEKTKGPSAKALADRLRPRLMQVSEMEILEEFLMRSESVPEAILYTEAVAELFPTRKEIFAPHIAEYRGARDAGMLRVNLIGAVQEEVAQERRIHAR